MLPVVAPPSSTQAVLDYLRPLMVGRVEEYAQDVWVQSTVPAHRPLVYVRRIGGETDLPGYDGPRIDVQVFHGDTSSRERLALLVHAMLKAAAGDRAGVAVVSYVSTLMGPRPMPDPANSSGEIYMLTVDLLVRAAS